MVSIFSVDPRVSAIGAGYTSGMAENTTGALDADERNSMPDRQYAFPDKRKEPIHDAAHVRNAIARFNQVTEVTDEERREAFERIKRAAQRFDVELTAQSWKDLSAPPGSGSEKSGSGNSARRSSGSDRTKDEPYAEAARRNIKGRSSMTKAQLQRALHG